LGRGGGGCVVGRAGVDLPHQARGRTDAAAQNEADDRLVIHRDELTFQLLQNARLEMASARIEVEDLRDEVRKLRSMENHFYHFQQSLDHLEALLFSDSSEARAAAERNARAFLTRMRRLNEAKGTLANEAQRAASEIQLLGDKDKAQRISEMAGQQAHLDYAARQMGFMITRPIRRISRNRPRCACKTASTARVWRKAGRRRRIGCSTF
jgi:hypothetical protein